VKEYAPQFRDAGFAAQDFVGHISQSATQGIFSDKGADVVKKFGLRIREKATSEAMQAAFGSEFTNKIFGGIKDGSLTVQQALAQVAKEMDETKIPANQLQTVIADVFGGPGEDADIAYLKSLKNVGKGVDPSRSACNASSKPTPTTCASWSWKPRKSKCNAPSAKAASRASKPPLSLPWACRSQRPTSQLPNNQVETPVLRNRGFYAFGPLGW
jgi:hypothetical protein